MPTSLLIKFAVLTAVAVTVAVLVNKVMSAFQAITAVI